MLIYWKVRLVILKTSSYLCMPLFRFMLYRNLRHAYAILRIRTKEVTVPLIRHVILNSLEKNSDGFAATVGPDERTGLGRHLR